MRVRVRVRVRDSLKDAFNVIVGNRGPRQMENLQARLGGLEFRVLIGGYNLRRLQFRVLI